VARKKPGKTSKAKPKPKARAARDKGPAGNAKARKAGSKKKVAAKKSARSTAARASRTAKSARTSPMRKTKKAVKPSTAAKLKPSAKKSTRAATPSASPSTKSSKPSVKSAGTPSAKSATPTKAPARVAPAKVDSGKKTTGKKGATVKAGPVPDAQGYVVINGRRVRMISTKGLVIPKRSSNNHAAAEKEASSNTPKKARKSRLTAKDLEYFRELLLLRRRQLAGDLTSMETEALRSSGGNSSHMPIHMADIGTDTFDQDFMLGLAANERVLLKEIDEALERIEKGEYGICALTGDPIPKSRLNAKPWAKYTVESARMVERGLTPS
jgi:DnaK suppressor protein